MDVQGRSVFLTGGARGLGRTLVEELLEKGAKVFFCDIIEDLGKATATELQKKYGDRVSFRLCDVSDSKDLTDAFEAAVSTFGAVDICVNNAGIANEGIWDKMIAINQVGEIRGSLLAYEHMRRDKGGRGGVIINVASMSGFLYGEFFNPVYTATKHALVAFTTGMANNPEMPARGIRWGCLCTNGVDTPLTIHTPDHVYEWERREELFRKHPRDLLKTSEVAVAFMVQLRDEANNGAVMKVAKQDGKAYYQYLVMDTSTSPIDRMIEKEKIFMK